MNKFWNWVRNEDTGASELIFNGPISEDTWFGDEITPAMFRNELSKVSGDLTVWLNSPGGDVFAASQIYTMLRRNISAVIRARSQSRSMALRLLLQAWSLWLAMKPSSHRPVC